MYHFQNYSHFNLNANTPAAFRARKVSGPFEKWGPGFHSGIPDSLIWILESKTRDSGFRKQKFPRIAEFGFSYMGEGNLWKNSHLLILLVTQTHHVLPSL